MAWTFKDELTRFDNTVKADAATEGRFTFNQYLYFEPDAYNAWRCREEYEGAPPYTAELIGNPNIPSAGTHLSGTLSSFYVNQISEITNLNSEDNGEATSYGMVTLEYENMESKSSSENGANADDDSKPPWQKHVDDFSISWQEQQTPLISGWIEELSANLNVQTTAMQPLYDFTTNFYNARITWTYFCRNESISSYLITDPIVNENDVTINRFLIPAGKGLLLPPTYRKLYYKKGKNDQAKAYDALSFEIIYNPKFGHDLEYINAGTQAIFDFEEEGGIGPEANIFDIGQYYIYAPSGAPPLSSFSPNWANIPIGKKEFTKFIDVLAYKSIINTVNKNIEDETKQYVFYGDAVQSPVPLNLEGYLDYSALPDARNAQTLHIKKYARGNWHLGWR